MKTEGSKSVNGTLVKICAKADEQRRHTKNPSTANKKNSSEICSSFMADASGIVHFSFVPNEIDVIYYNLKVRSFFQVLLWNGSWNNQFFFNNYRRRFQSQHKKLANRIRRLLLQRRHQPIQCTRLKVRIRRVTVICRSYFLPTSPTPSLATRNCQSNSTLRLITKRTSLIFITWYSNSKWLLIWLTKFLF